MLSYRFSTSRQPPILGILCEVTNHPHPQTPSLCSYHHPLLRPFNILAPLNQIFTEPTYRLIGSSRCYIQLCSVSLRNLNLLQSDQSFQSLHQHPSDFLIQITAGRRAV